jgi:hypothetical protein
MPRRGLATLYSRHPHDVGHMHWSSESERSDKLVRLRNASKPGSRLQDCKVAVDPAGNVSFVKLFETENDRTKQLLFKCAFLAGRYTRYKTAKQFLGYSKEMHLLEHCDMVGFDDSLAWLDSVPT